MTQTFESRRAAGRQLGQLLASRGYQDAVVLALPRGGVPVGYEVAIALHAPLDVFTVRKLGVPGHEELAMGAIASGGVRVIMPDIVDEYGISESTLESVSAAEQVELDRREHLYRDSRPLPHLEGHTVILVDDGIATGASMIAAIRAVRALHPRLVVAATPVMPQSARSLMLKYADACEAVMVLDRFSGVCTCYDDFSQVSDQEVRALLQQASLQHTSLPPALAGFGRLT